MEFFKVKKFSKAHKPNPERDSENGPVPQPEQMKSEDANGLCKTTSVDSDVEAEDDDDDFITNEVKRRLKELRRNSFMVLIPEESSPEDEEEEEEGETSFTEYTQWRDVEAEGRQFWSGFDAVYDKYCERMLFFDRLSAQQLTELESQIPSTSSRSASKKLASPFSCLSLKKVDEPEDETMHLQQLEVDPYQDLELAYVAQICLTWEALHCQYTQLKQKVSCQQDNAIHYNSCAQQFQQFQVLLQRFIENEPFEQGPRIKTYAQTRKSMPSLLQVPKIQGSGCKTVGEGDLDFLVLAPDLIRLVENSVLTFRFFLKMDKKKLAGGVRNFFGHQNQNATPLQRIQSSLQKKAIKLKDLRNKGKGWKKTSWPTTEEDMELLLGLIDAKVLSRVLQMVKISNDQLFWCEEKMKKLDLSEGKLKRDPSVNLFPC